MSQENVELVRQYFAQSTEGLDAFFEQIPPRLTSRRAPPLWGPHRGAVPRARGSREWLADVQQSFERFEL